MSLISILLYHINIITPNIRVSKRAIAIVRVVVVEVAVVAVEDPSVVDVVPLGKPSVRAGRSHI